ncbi:hypothetical protein NDU88_000241 [Pleurodeles waltl]|uniref:Uncharacterized protein n=1 Tax=Pleurodeles waltl TaxID=8319 RepID=A0AAV7R5D7_PLEWA|nr:hypothetical protein NDU88_000241 [Pleurodeles waltl]
MTGPAVGMEESQEEEDIATSSDNVALDCNTGADYESTRMPGGPVPSSYGGAEQTTIVTSPASDQDRKS